MFLVLLILVMLGVVGYAGYYVFGKNSEFKNAITVNRSNKSNKTSQASWAFDGSAWKAAATPPTCPDPLLSQSPVDISQATAILYPGQTRNQYKPHGGFLFGNNTDNDVDVSLAMDATAVDGVRYLENGTEQYLFDFINDCGIMLRYDHLLTLSDAFQQLADGLPEAKANQSQTTNFSTPKPFKAGDSIASAVGFPDPALNVSMDFGVYDLRKPNEASKNAAYASAHADVKSQAYYGICWLNDLPAADKTAALALPGGDAKAGKTSDYCK